MEEKVKGVGGEEGVGKKVRSEEVLKVLSGKLHDCI